MGPATVNDHARKVRLFWHLLVDDEVLRLDCPERVKRDQWDAGNRTSAGMETIESE
jgi:hypothetical protein